MPAECRSPTKAATIAVLAHGPLTAGAGQQQPRRGPPTRRRPRRRTGATPRRLKQPWRSGDRSALPPAVWTAAPRLLVFCLQPAVNVLTMEVTGPAAALKCCIVVADEQCWPRRST